MRAFEIDNFAAGIIPNAAWTNFRTVAAMDWENLRVDPNGFLIQRDGHRTIFESASESTSQVFAYRTLILAVMGGVLKWARARGRGNPITFNDFVPAFQLDLFNEDEPYHFQPVSVADREYILIGNGTGRPKSNLGGPYVVDLEDVFNPAEPASPTVYPFYVVNPSNPYGVRHTPVRQGISNSDYHDDNYVQLYFQAVRTTEEQEGVPWIADFTEVDQFLPPLAPTVAVSAAVPAIGIEATQNFTIRFGRGDLPTSGQLRVSALLGANVNTYLVRGASNRIDTQGGTFLWTLAAGRVEALFIKPAIQSSPSFSAYFEVSVDGGSRWKRLDASTFDVGAGNTRFRLDWGVETLGRLPTGTGLVFRLRTSQGGVRLTDSLEVRLSIENAFTLLTTSYEHVDSLDSDQQPRTEIRFRLNLPVPDAADYVDVYRSRRRDPPAPYAGGFYLMARLPHEDTYEFTLKFPATDNVLLENWIDELPEQGEVVSWRYAEVDSHRIYAVTPDESRIYLSYFDGIAERRYMNLVDYIDLPLAGDPITGIKFLDDTYLAVYTVHRILLVYTDPAPELIQVRGQYSQGPNDEAVGCVAPQSLVEIDQYHYFLSANKRVYRFGGRRPTWASSHVQPLLEPLNIPEADDASVQLSGAVAVAHKGFYCISFPSLEVAAVSDSMWQGRGINWRDGSTEWRTDLSKSNTTLIYDMDRDKWYRDGFGVDSYTKDSRDRLYGIIRGNIYALYDDPDSEEVIYWAWHSNYLMLPPRTVIYNVNVKTQVPVDMTLTVRTEEASQTRELAAADANDYWGQYAGFNLRGRTARLSIEGSGRTVIDRITINERL